MIVDDEARAAARAAGLPWLRGGMVEHGGGGHPVMEAQFYPWGPAHKEAMVESPLRDRLWAFIMQGEDLPQAGNRVDLDPTIRDARGFPVARITYRPHRHELVASAHHGPRHLRVLDEMGATRTGDDPLTSVVDRNGRLHDLPNVVVADSSVFVTSAGYGPTLTLVALAARAAASLVG